jgi:hypothetical protein
MNNLSRSIIFAACVGACAGGWIFIARDNPSSPPAASAGSIDAAGQNGYEYASGNFYKFTFAQLETLVRADAAAKFPNTRIELGVVKAERGILTVPVVFFGPNHQTQAFLYRLVPEKNSWKIAGTRRLWFVPSSEIARGLRV